MHARHVDFPASLWYCKIAGHQGPVPERCNSFIPEINVPYLVIYPWDKAHSSLELSYYTFQEPAPAYKSPTADPFLLYPRRQVQGWRSGVQGWRSGVQGWRSGESTRLPPLWPGFDSQIWRHMWVEFVGSLLCTERFSPGTPVSPLLKNHHLT